MDKFWLSQYQLGVPKEIDENIYASLPELFEKSFVKNSNKTAFANIGTNLSYKKLNKISLHFAAYLQSLGLKKGSRVAIMMPNLLQYAISIFAILRAGFVVVNVNPLYTPNEVSHQLDDAKAEAVIVLANFAHILETAKPNIPSLQHVIVTDLGDSFSFIKKITANIIVKHLRKMVPDYSKLQHIKFSHAIKKGALVKFSKPILAHTDIALLQYTGGTTGIAKGAVLTHKNLIANILQTTSWISSLNRIDDQIIITALPLYHIFSLTANLFTFFMIGAKNILITNPRDTNNFVKQIKNTKFTAITGVNTLFCSLLNHKKFRKINFKHLEITLSGGMTLQKNVASLWQKVTNKPILEAYGLTETSPAISINPLNVQKYTGSVGLPLPSTNISIRDANGKELPIGDIGELCVFGPQVMHEYWNKPDETKLSFWDDKFFRTGDSARIDDKGYLYIVDRIKDLIIISGFNVYPYQVEEVISQIPGVLEVAVIGSTTKSGREAVKACIVRKDESITESMIIEHCKNNLTSYKIPKIVEFYDELPKSNVGKILKRSIK